MKRSLQSSTLSALRWLLLVGSLVLTPQATLLHALSHGTSSVAAGRDKAPGHAAAADESCLTCLGLAQLGSALPSEFSQPDVSGSAPLSTAPADCCAAARKLAAVVARGPPIV